MGQAKLKNLNPRLGLIIGPSGIESITLIGSNSEETTAANKFCSVMEQELKIIDSLIKEKFNVDGEIRSFVS